MCHSGSNSSPYCRVMRLCCCWCRCARGRPCARPPVAAFVGAEKGRGPLPNGNGPLRRVKRRRATLPHPVECSTIAVQGLSFRVRNGAGRLTLAMVAANLQLEPAPGGRGKRTVAVREPESGRESMLNVLRCIPAFSAAGKPMPQSDAMLPPGHAREENGWGRRPPLVPVSSTPRGASTSGLSTTCSTWGVARPRAARNPNLGAGFPLRCFQRLSLPNVANRPCRWRDNRHTRGSSTQVLSYYGQASSGFQRAQRIETKLSHDVLNPARVPL